MIKRKNTRCSVKGCEGLGYTNKRGTVVFCRGYCSKHYSRFRTHGDVDTVIGNQSSVKHGMSKTPTWYSWAGMVERGTSKTYTQAKDYIERGITVSERWLGKNGFVNFYKDMGERPANHTLDRIDNDKGYSLENCRWATRSEQRMNQRRMKSV